MVTCQPPFLGSFIRFGCNRDGYNRRSGQFCFSHPRCFPKLARRIYLAPPPDTKGPALSRPLSEDKASGVCSAAGTEPHDSP